MTPADIAQAMGGRVERGAALVPGPGHSAADRSLSVKVDSRAPDGFIVHSFAGDDPIVCRDHVRQKMGMPAWQLTHGKNGHQKPIASGIKAERLTISPAQALSASFPLRTAPDENGKPRFVQWDMPPKRQDEVRRHIYRRADGEPVRVKIKQSCDPSYLNWFRVRDINGTLGWQAKKPEGFQPVAYVGAVDPFDPELKDSPAYWTEGEKDTDTAGSKNLPAFTFGGCGDGLPDGIEHLLAARPLIVCADNDVPGREHAEKKAARAYAAGAASIRILNFLELPPHGDLTDYLAGGGTVVELERRAEAAPTWQPSPPTQPALGGRSRWQDGAISASDLRGKTFAPVRYILPGFIPEGVTILAGKPKVGKSWMVLDLCIAVAAGRFILGTLKPPQGDALYLALEDSQRRLQRRLQKLLPAHENVWPDRLLLKTDWPRVNAGGLDDIREWCRSVANPTLLVIDTLEKVRPATNRKQQAYSADYDALTGLQKLANEHNLAVVINHHLRKMEADDPFDTISGTLGLTGAADTILLLKKQAGDVTLHARGRDIEESETALQFERASCRWRILGAASEVHVSKERAGVLAALKSAGPDGFTVPELMAATESRNRNAMDVLLFKMKEDGEIARPKRGLYVLPQYAGKIGKKERYDTQATENKDKSPNLTNLTDLTGIDGDASFEAVEPDEEAA